MAAAMLKGMKFSQVVATSQQISATRSRTAKVQAVAHALHLAKPGEARLVAHYLSGSLPQRRTGVGARSLSNLPAPAATDTLQVADVDAIIADIAALSGSGSGARRKEMLTDLFARATADEQRLLRDLFTGQVRHGALDGVLQTAIAAAADVPVDAVRRAVMLAGSSAAVVEDALAGGVQALERVGLVVGRPLMPMLAASAPDVAEAVQQAGEGKQVTVERKLDGIRLQAHKNRDEVRLFTRSLDDITDRLPEVVEVIAAIPAQKAVFDAEAIALRPDGRPHPFQVTAARTASRNDPATLAANTPVSTFVFDVLHRDGHDLLDLPAKERIEQLTALVDEAHLVPRVITDHAEKAAEFFAAQIEAGHEGVVVKNLQAPYAAGRRGAGWIKVKPRHTLELVVLAVEWGSGRRSGKLSNIHLGASDGADGFVMLGKTFKGMTDEMLDWQTTRFLELETHREGYVVHLRPEQVVEIAFDGLQQSTRYPAGLALRFARVLRYRHDKTADHIDTIDTVRALAGLTHGQ